MKYLYATAAIATAALVLSFAPVVAQDDWPMSFFKAKDAITGTKVAKGKDANTRAELAAEFLVAFNKGSFASAESARVYARQLDQLVGRIYYRTKDSPKLEIQSRSSVVKATKVDVKDDVLFKGIVKGNFAAGLKIPIVNMKFGVNEVSELTVQDLVSIVGDYNIDEVGCKFPQTYREMLKQNKDLEFYIISAATASSITKRSFSSNEQSGGGVFSILNLDGQRLYSEEAMSKTIVISINGERVYPLSGDACGTQVAARFERSTPRSALEQLPGLRGGVYDLPPPVEQ
jgi:hypothetical protein